MTNSKQQYLEIAESIPGFPASMKHDNDIAREFRDPKLLVDIDDPRVGGELLYLLGERVKVERVKTEEGNLAWHAYFLDGIEFIQSLEKTLGRACIRIAHQRGYWRK
tara:strand:+ start:718 stop:1038 length:321 start_codon:yes stop_codon:yes gene_type:complete